VKKFSSLGIKVAIQPLAEAFPRVRNGIDGIDGIDAGKAWRELAVW